MPSLVKQNTGIYHLYYYNSSREPKRISESLKTKSKSEASRRASKLETMYYEGEHDPWSYKYYEEGPPPIQTEEETEQKNETLIGAIEEYIHHKKTDPTGAGWSESSARSIGKRLRHYAGLFGEHINPYTIDEQMVYDRVFAKDTAKNTKAGDVRKIKAFLNWLHDGEINIRTYTAPQKLPSFLTTEQLIKIFEYKAGYIKETKPHCQTQDQEAWWMIDAWKFAARTGIRKTAVFNIRLQDIQNNSVTVVKAKGDKQRTIPLMDWAEGVAFRYADPKFRTRDRYLSRNDYLFGRPSPASAVKCSKEFTRCAGKALNLDRVFHDLRHTFAVWYLTAPSEKNTDFRLVALKNILGHSSLETTMIYTKLLPNQLRL